MKKIFTFSSLVLSLMFFAQEAGKSGELLKNEASKNEMQAKRSDLGMRSSIKTDNGVLDNSGRRNPNSNTYDGGFRKPSQPSYNWNQNFGYSEVFLRIPEMGYFAVEIGDQMISNNSGKFRFFDLSSGRMPISIYQNGYLIYRTQIRVQNNSRLVLDFFTNKGLFLLDTYPVQGQMYGFNEWDDVWNNPYGNSNGGNYGYNKNVMNDQQFGNFIQMLKRNASFDNDKMDMIFSQMSNTMFTSQQVKAMISLMSFDKNRLEVAKKAYSRCVDKPNYFVVQDGFDFSSAKKDLMQYISNAR